MTYLAHEWRHTGIHRRHSSSRCFVLHTSGSPKGHRHLLKGHSVNEQTKRNKPIYLFTGHSRCWVFNDNNNYVHKAPFLTGAHNALQLLRTFAMTKYASATDSLSQADITCSSYARAHSRALARTHTHTHTRTHARTHARTHTHTHTHTCSCVINK